ncbi:MAG: hypothetical protein EKK40_00615 [Bradyrhizobiaceae bacterium]|nr:MAG: hypothetical protein EKK40_00615 [Bradyrhizobiaceae bacterium]
MGKLWNRARNSNKVFAPLVFRLALRLEQITWSEVAESASEVVFVSRAAQRLFKLDAVCTNFDTWLEAESAGAELVRDDLGHVTGCAAHPASLPEPKSFAKADRIAHSVEVIRRLSEESNSALPLASLAFGSTLMARLYGNEETSRLLVALRNGESSEDLNSKLEYVRDVTIEIATGYLEAGATGLLLLHEENEPDLPELRSFAALFNLASYYDVPAVVMCRKNVDDAGLGLLQQVAGDFYVSPAFQSKNITALPSGPSPETVESSGWLGISRWEYDTDSEPAIIHKLRESSFRA